jgi:diguanylate cyclase (GGDEF)-like protein
MSDVQISSKLKVPIKRSPAALEWIAVATFCLLLCVFFGFFGGSQPKIVTTQLLEYQFLRISDPEKLTIDQEKQLAVLPKHRGASRETLLEARESAILRVNSQQDQQGLNLHFQNLRVSAAQFWIEGDPNKTPIQWKKTSDGVLLKPIHRNQLVQNKSFVIGVVTSSDFSRLKVELTNLSEDTISKSFDIRGGFYAGALIAISIFSLILSIILKDFTFLVFGVWSISTLRIALVNGGWDSSWLDLNTTKEAVDFLLRTTLALHAVLGLSLFQRLAGDWLTTGHRLTINFFKVALVIVFGFSLVANYKSVLPTIWILSTLTSVASIVIAFQITYKSKNRMALIFAIGWSLGLLGFVAEVAYVSGIVTSSIRSIFSVQLSAVLSVILTATALAVRVNYERDQRDVAEANSKKALTGFKRIFEQSPVGLFSIAETGEILSYNPKFAEILNLYHGQNHLFVELFPHVSFSQLTQSSKIITELFSPTKLGKRVLEITLKIEGNLFEGSLIDITERQVAEEKLLFAATRDTLTGLFNRRSVIEKIEQVLTEPLVIGNEKAFLAMIDIERFHQIVVNFGHSTGDQVLTQCAKRIESTVDGFLGRLSADTFAIIILGHSIDQVEIQLKSVLRKINSIPFSIDEKTFSVIARCGALELDPKRSGSSKDVLTACDVALETARRSGSGALVFFSVDNPDLARHKIELNLMAEFRLEIPVDKLFVLFQPIVNLNKPKTDIAYEALLRMRGDKGSFIYPSSFIPALEKNGLMSKIDRLVIKNVFDFFKDNPIHFSKLGHASINLSGASLNDEEFIADISDLILENRVFAKKVVFEITESIAIDNLESTKRFVAVMRAYGVRFALDDFGAGFSSFNYLKDLNVDFIKIDGALIKSMGDSEVNFAIVKSIADLGNALKIHVVAEWIEDLQTLSELMKLGVHSGQGWALGKPQTPERIALSVAGIDFVTDPNIAQMLTKTEIKTMSLETTQVAVA